MSAPFARHRKILPVLAIVVGLGGLGQSVVDSGLGSAPMLASVTDTGAPAPVAVLRGSSFNGSVSTTVQAFDLSAYSSRDFGDNP